MAWRARVESRSPYVARFRARNLRFWTRARSAVRSSIPWRSGSTMLLNGAMLCSSARYDASRASARARA
eukprot:2820405-Lingulodinium_polyedra.AAC.1